MVIVAILTVFDEWYTEPIAKNTQNHWCTNRHRSTKTVPTVYQRRTNRKKTAKDIQKTVKTGKMTIGVPITVLLYGEVVHYGCSCSSLQGH